MTLEHCSEGGTPFHRRVAEDAENAENAKVFLCDLCASAVKRERPLNAEARRSRRATEEDKPAGLRSSVLDWSVGWFIVPVAIGTLLSALHLLRIAIDGPLQLAAAGSAE